MSCGQHEGSLRYVERHSAPFWRDMHATSWTPRLPTFF